MACDSSGDKNSDRNELVSVLLEKLIVAQLADKFPSFYEI
jgi:hypothetical protein